MNRRPHGHRSTPSFGVGMLVLLYCGVLSAAPVDFVRDVRPIFQKHCYECHGPEKQKNGLRLDIKGDALKGGIDHAPNIIPGKAASSPLIQFVRGEVEDLQMPPKGERLTSAEVATLAAWINQGAPWPDGVDAAAVVDKRDHWAFKPLRSGDIRKNAGGTSDTTIDTFIAAKLRENGLTLSPQADARTLIRRLYFVLHGLPPSPEEVEAFVRDTDPKAYEKLVDRLLASPRYGEKWARHWLDVIAFGETHGFEVNTPRENAWPYRDYVIEAFNKDTPYPRFILEQLAGDAFGVDAATGFIVASAALLPGQIGKDEESKAKARQDELSDMVSITGGAFLGLTLHCARCHDHKFDPVTQTDYYGLQAIFAGVHHGERPLTRPGMKPQESEQAQLLPKLAQTTHRLIQLEPISLLGKTEALPPVNAHRNIDRFAPIAARKLRFTVLATSEDNRYEPCFDELEIYSVDGRNIALAECGAKATASDGSPNSARHRLSHVNDGHYGNERSWLSGTKGGGWVQIEFARREQIEAVVWGRDRLDKFRDRLPVKYRIEVADEDGVWKTAASSDDRIPLGEVANARQALEPAGLNPQQMVRWHEWRGELAALESKLKAFISGPMAYAGRLEQPGPTFRLHRGEAMQQREEVVPAAVTAIGPALSLKANTPEQSRRIALANWLADPVNPLPARVMMNRLWQHLFGEGIVATPNDFGRNGAKPSHPELLDWIAAEFIRGGWSIKRMQKMIVMSQTWRQASSVEATAPKQFSAQSSVVSAQSTSGATAHSALRTEHYQQGLRIDAGCRLLWRYPPRRLDAEAVRDTILASTGALDLRMGGPGFSVFAPNNNYVRVYDPKTDFGPAEWRRMIYVTKVRMAQDSTFGSFDCPDAGQSQPKRPRSTTAIQALSLFNSSFVNQQAALFADRLKREAGTLPTGQIKRAFALTVQRAPTLEEATVCESLVNEHGLPALCRVLLNANEFLFVP